MNEEEEEAPRVRQNRLARERRAARSKEQRAMDANRQATQRPMRSNVQINLENATCANAWTLLHPNRNRKPITRIVKLAKASENSCWKSVTKKSVTLIIKHAVPSLN